MPHPGADRPAGECAEGRADGDYGYVPEQYVWRFEIGAVEFQHGYAAQASKGAGDSAGCYGLDREASAQEPCSQAGCGGGV